MQNSHHVNQNDNDTAIDLNAGELNKRISVQKEDYLKQDPPIRGQNYACISFVSPEQVLRTRELFELGEFLRGLSEDVTQLFSTIQEHFASDPKVAETLDLLRERYTYLRDGDELQQQLHLFKSAKADDLNKAFQAKHGFQTSIRGFKIRGVHDSIDEARAHSKEINRLDPNFNVFIAQVGCWCPWSPNADDISNSEYAETELNTLVRNYNANVRMMNKKYEDRKRDKVESARKHAAASSHGISLETPEEAFSAKLENEDKENPPNSSVEGLAQQMQNNVSMDNK